MAFPDYIVLLAFLMACIPVISACNKVVRAIEHLLQNGYTETTRIEHQIDANTVERIVDIILEQLEQRQKTANKKAAQN
jgi:hypothetical protein